VELLLERLIRALDLAHVLRGHEQRLAEQPVALQPVTRGDDEGGICGVAEDHLHVLWRRGQLVRLVCDRIEEVEVEHEAR
jgi:hypothetical protein